MAALVMVVNGAKTRRPLAPERLPARSRDA